MKKPVFLLLCFVPVFATAQLQLARIFSDNMVLQRDKPVCIWGKATPGAKVDVQMRHFIKTAVAKDDSSWMVFFPPQTASNKPLAVTATSGNEKIGVRNILIGDVWIASGQSNMEWPMSKEMHWQEEKKNARQPLIRFNNPPPAGRSVYGVAYTDSLQKRLNTNDFYLWGSWQQCDSHSVTDMSAVAYYFAKAIVEKEAIPTGIINLSIGGAPIETFISREAMLNSNLFASKVKGNWLENNRLPQWIRERGKQNVGGNPAGFKDDLGPNHAYKPGFAYESGIKPLLPMPIKGIIWYQGESNSLEKERVEEYKDLLHLLIDDYRKGWQQRDMPFYWVQLSSIDTSNYGSHYWPEFRDGQRQLLDSVKNGGMAVCSDIGLKNNVHPTNKKEVGKRLARWALAKTYKKEMVPSGPLPLKAEYKDGKIIVRFQYAKGLTTSDEKPLRGFSTDGKTEARAKIEKDKVTIMANEKPGYVYYGWKPFSDANLVNSENLPASTFKIKLQ